MKRYKSLKVILNLNIWWILIYLYTPTNQVYYTYKYIPNGMSYGNIDDNGLYKSILLLLFLL